MHEWWMLEQLEQLEGPCASCNWQSGLGIHLKIFESVPLISCMVCLGRVLPPSFGCPRACDVCKMLQHMSMQILIFVCVHKKTIIPKTRLCTYKTHAPWTERPTLVISTWLKYTYIFESRKLQIFLFSKWRISLTTCSTISPSDRSCSPREVKAAQLRKRCW